MRGVLLIIFLVLYNTCFAQKNEFKLYQSNDAWFKTDIYYTEGIRIEYLHYKKLLHLKQPFQIQTNKYYTSFDYKVYTSSDIEIPYIMYGDRPYASTFVISQISEGNRNNFIIKSGYSIGVIGPITRAGNLQTAFHKEIDSPQPMGWKYQIANNPLIAYQYEVKKYFLDESFIKHTISTNGIIGTDNILGVSTNLKFPYFKNKFMEVYTYGSVGSNLVLWNSTLNGGFINKSVYTLRWNEVERIVNSYTVGIMLKVKGIGISTSITGISKEFKTGMTHKWSNVDLVFTF